MLLPIEELTREQVYNERYVLRGLRDDEVRSWSEFCASVFSYKANPPPADYFYRHYANDPNRGSSRLIRVAISSQKIVASCRIFLRRISAATSSLSAGGIGEVCTHIDHRRKGLSRALLKESLTIMTKMNLEISCLHAAPAFFPLYESLGYCHAGSLQSGNRWSRVMVNVQKPSSAASSTIRIRQARFPRDADQLLCLHARYSQDRLEGCVLRTREYWANYLSKELEGSLFVLEENDTIRSWWSLRPINGTEFSLREYGRSDATTTTETMGHLLAHAVSQATHFEDDGTLWLTLPGFVRDELSTEDDTNGIPLIDWTTETATVDNGWMYRALPSPTSSATAAEEFCDFIRSNNHHEHFKNRQHFVWPSDSF